MQVKDLLLELDSVLLDGIVTRDYVLSHSQSLLSLVRNCNVSLRWLLLHRSVSLCSHTTTHLFFVFFIYFLLLLILTFIFVVAILFSKLQSIDKKLREIVISVGSIHQLEEEMLFSLLLKTSQVMTRLHAYFNFSLIWQSYLSLFKIIFRWLIWSQEGMRITAWVCAEATLHRTFGRQGNSMAREQKPCFNLHARIVWILQRVSG